MRAPLTVPAAAAGTPGAGAAAGGSAASILAATSAAAVAAALLGSSAALCEVSAVSYHFNHQSCCQRHGSAAPRAPPDKASWHFPLQAASDGINPSAIREAVMDLWRRLDEQLHRIEASLPSGKALQQ